MSDRRGEEVNLIALAWELDLPMYICPLGEENTANLTDSQRQWYSEEPEKTVAQLT